MSRNFRICALGALAIAVGAQLLPLAAADASTSTSTGALSPRGASTVLFASDPGTINATLSCTGRSRINLKAYDPARRVIAQSSVNCRSGGGLSFQGETKGEYTLSLLETKGVATSYSVTVNTPSAPTPTTPTTVVPTTPTTTAPPAPSGGAYPTTPPAQVCGNAATLNGQAMAPAGAVTVPAGDNLIFFQNESYRDAASSGRIYYFAPGVHTLGDSPYGQITPKPGDSYVGAPGAILDGQHLNRYAFTGKAAGVRIEHLTIRHFVAPGDEAVVNHDSGIGWVIAKNTIHFNGGAGAYLGNDNRLERNCLADNSQYGYQADGDRITVTYNEIARNNTYDWETNQPGCGCSGGAKHWGAGPGVVSHNWVHDNANVGLWWDNNNIGFLIEGNYIADNFGHGIEYETSYNFRIANNYLARNAWGIGKPYQDRGDPFPQAAIYISESGGDPRLNGGVYGTSTIEGNYFLDNWNGVTLWENADRYGHDDTANTSKGYTSLAIDPTGAWPSPKMALCGPDQINATASRKWDCRWRTMNVQVTDNQFIVRDRAAMGCVGHSCAQQAVFSNYGSVPAWSPFLGRLLQDSITFRQGNVFARNTYVGDWRFVPYEAVGATLSFAQWQSAPYSQDVGSTG